MESFLIAGAVATAGICFCSFKRLLVSATNQQYDSDYGPGSNTGERQQLLQKPEDEVKQDKRSRSRLATVDRTETKYDHTIDDVEEKVELPPLFEMMEVAAVNGPLAEIGRSQTDDEVASAVTPHSEAIRDIEELELEIRDEDTEEEAASMATAMQSIDTSSQAEMKIDNQTKPISLYEASKSQLKEEVSSDSFKLFIDPTPPQPTRRKVHDSLKYAFVVEGLLTARECEEFVRRTEAIGFTKWTDDESRLAFRDCDTIEITHCELANLIWERLRPLMTSEELDCFIDRESDPERWQRDLEGQWKADGTVNSILFSRYLEGGHFAIHTDGFNIETFDRRSLFSLVLYLNDVPDGDGGETIFFANEGKDKMDKDELGRIVGDPKYIVSKVPARAGTCSVFFHNILHQSEPIRIGSGSRKYIIRSDVMYSRTPPIITDPKDTEAFAMYQKAESLSESDPEESARLFRSAFKRSVILSRIYGM